MCLLRKFKSFFLLCIVCLSARITACLITIVNLINEVWTRAFVFLTTLIKRTGVNSIILRVKHGRVAGIHNLHMSSNSYIRINLEMQYHTISVLLQSNIENEGFTRQTIYTVNCWAPIQRGLRPDRPTQPETWRCSETLQGGKKIQQPGIPLQSTTEACCHRRCQKHVLWLCLCKSLTRSPIFAENCSTNLLKLYLVRTRTICLNPSKGNKAQAVSPNGPSQSHPNYQERNL